MDIEFKKKMFSLSCAGISRINCFPFQHCRTNLGAKGASCLGSFFTKSTLKTQQTSGKGALFSFPSQVFDKSRRHCLLELLKI